MSKSKLTPAQHAARLANSQRATGPRSEFGKSRAAKNALIHGLCSLAPVLPGEDPAEFERMLAQYLKEMDPGNPDERRMVFEMCCANRALDRVRKADAAALIVRMRDAGAAWDEARAKDLGETTHLVGRGRQDLVVPLLARADGVRWLIGQWEWLDEHLVAEGGLHPTSRELMTTLLGCPFGDYADERAREVHGLSMALDVACGENLETHAKYQKQGIVIDNDRPMQRLQALIAGELEALRSLLPELEQEEAEQRQQVVDAASVDISDDGARRHRYEQAHLRTLRQLSAALIASKMARLKLYGRILSSSHGEPDWTPPAEPAKAPEPPARNEPKNDATLFNERISDGSLVPATARPASEVVIGVAPTPVPAPQRRL